MYYPNERVLGFSPSSGVSDSSTLVTVVGEHFVQHSLACVFSEERAASAVLLSSTAVLCQTPTSVPVAGHVGVASNGQDFAYSAGSFKSIAALSLSSSYPQGGSTAGGDVVTIIGYNLRPQVACLFDMDEVTPTFVSSTMTLCRSPRHEAGVAELAVRSFESGQLAKGLTYRFSPAWMSVSVSPSAVPAGTPTLLNVRGDGFEVQSSLTCLFGPGAESSPAAVLSSTLLTCTTPPLAAGAAALEVAVGGDAARRVRAPLLVHEPIALQAIAPSTGWACGGARVVLRGRGFVASDALACRFGARAVAATLVAPGYVECVAPPLPVAPVHVAVANTGQVDPAQVPYPIPPPSPFPLRLPSEK